MVQPAILYEIEKVLLTKRQERKIDGMEIWILRFAQGVTRKNKIRNKVVKKE